MSELLEAIVAQATGVSPARITIFPRAPLEIQANRLFDAWVGLRHMIVKEFLLTAEQHVAPAREYNALKLLAPLDIAPQPVFYDPALGPIVIYEFMEGEMWDRRRPTAAGLAQLAGTWLKMNAVKSDHLWVSNGYDRPLQDIAAALRANLKAYADWAEAEFTPGRRAAALCLTALESRGDLITELAGEVPVTRFCRADPRFANVIERPDGRLGLIDWEDSGLRDPARDLADILTHPNQEDLLSQDDWRPFIEPYVAERGQLDPRLMRRAQLYLALFPIFWLTRIMAQGLSRAKSGGWQGWSINGLPPNVRLRRFLARALAWPSLAFQSELESLADLAFFPAG